MNVFPITETHIENPNIYGHGKYNVIVVITNTDGFKFAAVRAA